MAKPSRGRPRLQPEDKKQSSLAFRPAANTRRQLEEAAEKEGHSLSAEVERRLTLSFLQEPQLETALKKAFGGGHNYVLGFLFARVACGVEHAQGYRWDSSAATLRAVGTAIIALLQRMQAIAPSDQRHCPLLPDTHAHEIGQGLANPKWEDQQVGQLGLPSWLLTLWSIERELRSGIIAWPLTGDGLAQEGEPKAFGVPNADELQQMVPFATERGAVRT